jgi:hypothetical protein
MAGVNRRFPLRQGASTAGLPPANDDLAYFSRTWIIDGSADTTTEWLSADIPLNDTRCGGSGTVGFSYVFLPRRTIHPL